MKLELTTAATEEPVDPGELTMRARISTSSEGSMLTDMLAEARDAAELHTGSRFITQTWTAYYDRFADLVHGLPFAPVVSITSLTYVDTDGDTQTVASSVYELGPKYGIGRVRLKYDQVWPTDVRLHEDVVIVKAVYGYGAKAAVPLPIKAAIIVHAANAYAHRDEGDATTPKAFCNLLARHNYTSYRPKFWKAAAA